MIVIPLKRIEDQAAYRPEGYYDHVVSCGEIRGTDLYLSESEYAALCMKYRPAHAVPVVLLPCPNRTEKVVRKKCCGDVPIMYCLERQDFTSRTACAECQKK